MFLNKKNIFVFLFLIMVVPIAPPIQGMNWSYYTIQSGDSLLKIARLYDISVGEISFWNNISNPNKIQIGQTLRLIKGVVNVKDILRLNEKDILSLWQNKISFDSPLNYWQVLIPYRENKDSPNYGVWLDSANSNLVMAAWQGTVQQVGFLRGYGNFILIDHQNGWLTMYSYLDHIDVQEKQAVQRGQTLGSCLKQKLFFLTSYKGRPVNPEIIVHKR